MTFAASYGDVTNPSGGAVLHLERKDGSVTERPKYKFRYKMTKESSYSSYVTVSTTTLIFSEVYHYVGFLDDADVQPTISGALAVYAVDFVELDATLNVVAMKTLYPSGP